MPWEHGKAVISYEHRVAHNVMMDRVKRKPVST